MIMNYQNAKGWKHLCCAVYGRFRSENEAGQNARSPWLKAQHEWRWAERKCLEIWTKFFWNIPFVVRASKEIFQKSTWAPQTSWKDDSGRHIKYARTIKSISSAMSVPLLRTGSTECLAGRFVSSESLQTTDLKLLQEQNKSCVLSKVMPHLKNLSELIETKASVLFFFSPYQMWIRFYHQETFMCSSVNRCIWIVWEQKTDLMFRQQENVACLQQMWGCRCCTFPEWCPALKVCFDIKIVVRLTVMILWCRAIKLYLVKLQSRIISC